MQFIAHLQKNNVNLRVFHPIYKNRNEPKKEASEYYLILTTPRSHPRDQSMSNKLQVCEYLLDQVAR